MKNFDFGYSFRLFLKFPSQASNFAVTNSFFLFMVNGSQESLRRRANARNVSFRISLRWLIYIVNSVDKNQIIRNLDVKVT